jgi:hypothetical protein
LRLERNAPVVLLAAGVAASVVLLLVYGSGLTFFQDEWTFLLHRRGFNADAFLLPHNEHITVIPVAVYKLLLALFGMESAAPFRVVATLLLGGTAVLLFAYVRRRVGDWMALFAALLVLFLGAAWQVLLWPFEMMLVGSLAAGIGMLLALDREDRSGDLVACALLVVSVLCSSLGIAFALAALVDVAQRREQWRSRAFIPAIPLALYAIWYLAYGHKADSALSFHNIANSPVYLLDGVASALQSLLGLLPEGVLQPTSPDWGRAALVVLVVLLAIVLRGRPLSRRVWVVGTAAAAFWLLAGFNFVPAREAVASRYQYTGAVFVLLILAELLRGRSPSVWGLRIGAVIVAASLLSNIATLTDARDYLRGQTDLAQADLGAIQIARRTVDPAFTLTPDVAGTANLIPVDAGSYLSAVDAFGSPADTPAEVASAPEADRAQADIVLVHGLPVTLNPDAGTVRAAGPPPLLTDAAGLGASRKGACVALPAGAAAGGVGFTLSSGGAIVQPAAGGSATIRLRRYSTSSFPLNAALAGGSTGLLTIPPDLSSRPWQLQVQSDAAVTVCGAAPS